MAYTPQSWRKLFSHTIKERDHLAQLASCEKLRHLMQERLIELSSDGQTACPEVEKERKQIEDALRKVWRIEQKALKSR